MPPSIIELRSFKHFGETSQQDRKKTKRIREQNKLTSYCDFNFLEETEEFFF